MENAPVASQLAKMNSVSFFDIRYVFKYRNKMIKQSQRYSLTRSYGSTLLIVIFTIVD